MAETIDERLERLKIDSGIRTLITELWERGYETASSCQGSGNGHGFYAFVSVKDGTGDGWFEDNASHYGLTRRRDNECCPSFGKALLDSDQGRNGEFVIHCCPSCGAGINGFGMYEGRLKEVSD